MRMFFSTTTNDHPYVRTPTRFFRYSDDFLKSFIYFPVVPLFYIVCKM